MSTRSVVRRWDDSLVTTNDGARRRYRRRELAIIFGAILIGIVLLLGALAVPMSRWFPNPEPSWWGWLEGVLLNVGAAFLILAPIEWFSSRLRQDVEAVETRQEERVEEVRREAADRTARLERKVASLSELNTQVSERLDAGLAEDEAMFRAFAAGPTAERVEKALKQALKRDLIHEAGVRVPVSNDDDARLLFRTSSRGLELDLETIAGEVLETIAWPAEEPAVDALTRVGRALEKAGRRKPDPTLIFERLSESLLLAAREPGLRPLVEYFPPQWVVTTEAIVGFRGQGQLYVVSHNVPNRLAMDAHVKGKPWLDYESYDEAHGVAAYLFPLTDRQLINERLRAREYERDATTFPPPGREE